jgi:hypothetical protein
MASLVDTVASPSSSSTRYLVIPMSRLLSNDAVLANNSLALAAERADLLPSTPDEPQVGFRFDADASYQIEMRYGRRSKLELLWRLGAIPFNRALHLRTWPWERSDKTYLTAESYRSIRPPTAENIDEKEAPEADAAVWVKAGWVYRLFGGDRSQEEEGPEAGARRNVNRIKGLVSFIERLDEKVARGLVGGSGSGFRQDRLWTWDGAVVDRLAQLSRHRPGSLAWNRVDMFEARAGELLEQVLQARNGWVDEDAEQAALKASVLAMAGHLTHNATYSLAAARYIKERFIDPFKPAVWTGSGVIPVSGTDPAASEAAKDEASVGYIFPVPTTGELPIWTVDEDAPASATVPADQEEVVLPFDPLSFDPSLLLDTFRLLSRPWLGQTAMRSDLLPKWRVQALASAHLAHLLLDRDALELSRHPRTLDEGAGYDVKVAALAAFLDDARLLGRVATRAHLRVSVGVASASASASDDEADANANAGGKGQGTAAMVAMTRPTPHDWLARGLANVKLKPWDTDRSSYWFAGRTRPRGRVLKDFEALGLS